MDDLCIVYDVRSGLDSLAPVCVLAIAFCCQCMATFPSAQHEAPFLPLLERLLRSSAGFHISVWITIYGTSTNSSTNKTTKVRARTQLAEALEIYKAPSSCTKDSSSESLISGSTDMVTETSSDDGVLVEGPGAGVVRWFKEWLDQSDIKSGDLQTDRRSSWIKIEWSSDTQELVGLRGWMRLY